MWFQTRCCIHTDKNDLKLHFLGRLWKNVGHKLLSCLPLSLLTKQEIFTSKLISAWTILASSAVCQRDHSPNRGSGHSREVFTWLLYMLTPAWHYVAVDARLPQVAASLRPLDLPTVNPLEAPDVLSESQTKNKWSYKLLEEKKPNRRRGRKQPGSRNKGVQYTDTKPAQLSKHGNGSSPPGGDVVAEIWVRRAGSESRNPGLTLESCRAITSSRLGRESLKPSLARSC